MTKRDYSQLCAYRDSLDPNLPFLLGEIIALRLKLKEFDATDDRTAGENWEPFLLEDYDDREDTAKFIVVVYQNEYARYKSATRKALIEDVVIEELLHSLDKTKAGFSLIDPEEGYKLNHDAYYAYSLEVLPSWLKSMWDELCSERIKHWQKLEEQFGKDYLKKGFFGKGELDYKAIVEASKQIRKSG
jgi:hypothetical protein